MQTPYSQIMEFCKNKNVSELQSKILLHKFYKDYYEIIENYKVKEKKEPTDEILKGFESTLLSDTTLQGNLKLSNEEVASALSKEINKHDQIISIKNFGLSIISGVIASFIFTILLFITLNLAQNQIKEWINNWYQTDKQIEDTVNRTTDQYVEYT